MCFTLHHTKTEIPPPPSAVGKKINIYLSYTCVATDTLYSLMSVF